jgi:hypothetical protein
MCMINVYDYIILHTCIKYICRLIYRRLELCSTTQQVFVTYTKTLSLTNRLFLLLTYLVRATWVSATVQPNYSIWPLSFPLLADVTYLFPMTLLSGRRHRGAQSVTPYPPDTLSAVCILLHEQLMAEQVECISLAHTSIQSRAPDVSDGL